jgi:thiamine pyrophosphate-dependent acetolactate synthase large subunit-like protein
MMLGKFHEVTLPLWGEIGATVALLTARVSPHSRPERREYVVRLWANWRAEKEKRAHTFEPDGRIPNAFIFHELSQVAPEDAVIAIDVGNNAYSFGMYFEAKRQHVLMSGYLGSIGFAFPAAMGAWAAAPERKIMAVAGDGGFGQYMAEFTTAVKYHMPITLIVLNNAELAKISREQRGANFHVWQTSLVNPNFALYAESCGGLGIRVEKAEALRPALEKALAHDGPSLVEVISSAGQL